jgi:hypothetical protein
MTTYRSKLEARLAAGPLKGAPYEAYDFFYDRPQGRYTPDFSPLGCHIEVKGFFSARDRTKMLQVKKQYPNHDLRFVFQTPYQTLNKKSDTTYAQWAEKHGFPWCDAKDTTTLARWAKGEL